MGSFLLRLPLLLFLLASSRPTVVESFRLNSRASEIRISGGTERRQQSTRLRSSDNPVAENTSRASVQTATRYKNFEQVLDTFHAEPLIIYFSTQKCGPCQLMKREVETMRKNIGSDMKLFSIDTEKWPRVGSRFAVTRLPCLVVFQEGEIKLRLEGVNKAEEVLELVRTMR